MSSEPKNLICFGTAEPASMSRSFSAGALTLDFSDGAIRRLSWHGIEVVRGIACPIRDANWATHASELIDESITETSGEFEICQTRLVADGALSVKLVFKGSSEGVFRATAEMAASREFITNRAGFTLLHPLRDVAGTPMRILHPDGSATPSQFPSLISPDEVAGDMAGLSHSVSGIDTDILFHGEVFEMEDQRNWSDASFKTYCRPLSLPKPYRLQQGEVQRQEIHIRFRGTPNTASKNGLPQTGLEWKAGAGKIPQIAIAIEDSTRPDLGTRELARLLNPKILQLRLTPQTASAVCESAKAMVAASPAEIELEIVVPSIDDPESAIAHVAAACKSASLSVARVLALPENYLRSYQPAGPWPLGPKPHDLSDFVRKSFPDAQIGGGVLTYFTELNRCRPPASLCDYVTHGSTAITHAADDRSVTESLEGLSHIFRSSGAIAHGRDYRLGLVAIGMRSNPYGAGTVDNFQQNRIAMAGADPRQRALFAAAWAVGAVAATQGHQVSSLALSALVGPFGVIHRPETWAQPLYRDAGMVYPLFHVVRFLSAMGGSERLSPPALENGLIGVASKQAGRISLILANLRTGVSSIRLPHKSEVHFLNARTFPAATHDPQWLDTSAPEHVFDFALESLDVAFVKMPA